MVVSPDREEVLRRGVLSEDDDAGLIPCIYGVIWYCRNSRLHDACGQNED